MFVTEDKYILVHSCTTTGIWYEELVGEPLKMAGETDTSFLVFHKNQLKKVRRIDAYGE